MLGVNLDATNAKGPIFAFMKASTRGRIALFLTFLLLLFTVVTWAVPFLDMDLFPWLQLAPVLDAFFLFMAVIIFVLAVTAYKRQWFLLPVPVLFVALFFVRYPSVLRLNGAEAQGEFSILTYNVKQFRNDTAMAAGVVRQIRGTGADIVCLQEFGLHYLWPDTRSVVEDFANRTGYRYFSFQHHPDNIFGIALLSRFPIVKTDTVFMVAGPTNGAGTFHLETPAGPLVIANLHLQSFNITAKGLPQISQVVRQQYGQMKRVLGSLPPEAPVIVAGDFNAVRGSATVALISSGMASAFDKTGSGFGATMKLFYPIGIDHVFFGNGLGVSSCRILDWPFSDHKPMLASFTVVAPVVYN